MVEGDDVRRGRCDWTRYQDEGSRLDGMRWVEEMTRGGSDAIGQDGVNEEVWQWMGPIVEGGEGRRGARRIRGRRGGKYPLRSVQSRGGS